MKTRADELLAVVVMRCRTQQEGALVCNIPSLRLHKHALFWEKSPTYRTESGTVTVLSHGKRYRSKQNLGRERRHGMTPLLAF